MPTCAVLFKDGSVGSAVVDDDKLSQPLIAYRMNDMLTYNEEVFSDINPAPSLEMKTFLPVKVFNRTVVKHTTWTVFLET